MDTERSRTALPWFLTAAANLHFLDMGYINRKYFTKHDQPNEHFCTDFLWWVSKLRINFFSVTKFEIRNFPKYLSIYFIHDDATGETLCSL